MKSFRRFWSALNRPLRWALILTFGWFVVAGLLLSLFTSCDPKQTSCLGPNEMGDLLAGLFAPVAFVWVAVAVFIQSNELRAQREELSLTREEMKQTRGVLEAQHNETVKQAEFIGKQTEILSQEHAIRLKTNAREGIRRSVHTFCRELYYFLESGRLEIEHISGEKRPVCLDDPPPEHFRTAVLHAKTEVLSKFLRRDIMVYAGTIAAVQNVEELEWFLKSAEQLGVRTFDNNTLINELDACGFYDLRRALKETCETLRPVD